VVKQESSWANLNLIFLIFLFYDIKLLTVWNI